ncbi:MAG: serpin family protein, partial [Bacteroidota bacterium]
MKFITGFLLIGTLLGTCGKQDDADHQPVIDFTSDKKAAQLIQADNHFALDLFDEIFSLEERENFMISPLSVAIALGMTYNGAAGETKSAFEETLRLSGFSKNEINKIHGELIKHLLSVDPAITMEIANSIWLSHIFSLQQEFADTNRYYYDAEINSLDFNDPGSVGIINNWVSENTQQKIPVILEEIPPMV